MKGDVASESAFFHCRLQIGRFEVRASESTRGTIVQRRQRTHEHAAPGKLSPLETQKRTAAVRADFMEQARSRGPPG